MKKLVCFIPLVSFLLASIAKLCLSIYGIIDAAYGVGIISTIGVLAYLMMIFVAKIEDKHDLIIDIVTLVVAFFVGLGFFVWLGGFFPLTVNSLLLFIALHLVLITTFTIRLVQFFKYKQRLKAKQQ